MKRTIPKEIYQYIEKYFIDAAFIEFTFYSWVLKIFLQRETTKHKQKLVFSDESEQNWYWEFVSDGNMAKLYMEPGKRVR